MLESLGGGEVALARAHASLFVPQGTGQLTSTGLVLGQSTYEHLMAYAEEQAGLVASRLSKVRGWLLDVWPRFAGDSLALQSQLQSTYTAFVKLSIPACRS